MLASTYLLSALLHKKTSKHKGDFCLNCLNSFRTENKLKSHEKVCKTKDFCGIEMPTEKKKILEFKQYMKSDKMPCIIYADVESLIRKIDACANNPEKSSTTEKGKHILCGYSISTIWGFDNIVNKHTLYRGKDCMKMCCNSLKEYAENIIAFEKIKMLSLTREELISYQYAEVCYICGRKILRKVADDINYRKVRDHCHYAGKYRGAAYSICNLKFNVPNEIPAVSRGSNYDYHFINK